MSEPAVALVLIRMDNYIRRVHRTLNSFLCCLIQRAMRVYLFIPVYWSRLRACSLLWSSYLLTHPNRYFALRSRL